MTQPIYFKPSATSRNPSFTSDQPDRDSLDRPWPGGHLWNDIDYEMFAAHYTILSKSSDLQHWDAFYHRDPANPPHEDRPTIISAYDWALLPPSYRQGTGQLAWRLYHIARLKGFAIYSNCAPATFDQPIPSSATTPEILQHTARQLGQLAMQLTAELQQNQHFTTPREVASGIRLLSRSIRDLNELIQSQAPRRGPGRPRKHPLP